MQDTERSATADEKPAVGGGAAAFLEQQEKMKAAAGVPVPEVEEEGAA